MTTISQGEEMFKKGEKKANAFFFKDYDNAYEYFERAGAYFKIEQNFFRAGDAFMRAGDCAIKLKNNNDAVSSYIESAELYKKVDIKKAEVMFSIAIKIRINNNNLLAAAKLEKDFADMLEANNKSSEALEHYKIAKQYFIAEDDDKQVIQI